MSNIGERRVVMEDGAWA